MASEPRKDTASADPTASKAQRRVAEPKRSSRRGQGATRARYFLAAGSEQDLVLGEEKPSEHDAMVAALKKDVTFVIVTEWQTRVESGRGGPVIRKEAAMARKT